MRPKVGDVQAIGGIRVVCVPDYFITRVGMDPGTAGILLPSEAADALVEAMRKAGLVLDAAQPQPTPSGPVPVMPSGRKG